MSTGKIDSALKSLAAEGPLSVCIRGDCMDPLIRDGSRVQVQPERHYWPGDIIVVRAKGGPLIAHRLIGIFPRHNTLKYITQADSAIYPDGAISRVAIIGRICGGNCRTRAFEISLQDRIRAVWRFARFIIRFFAKKV